MSLKSKDENISASYNLDCWVPSSHGELDTSFDIKFNELEGQMSFDFEGDLRKKYPALQDAWDHYQTIKQMCETREKEEENEN